MSLTVSVDVKQHWTVLRHSSQYVPNMSTDIRGHEALLHHIFCESEFRSCVKVEVAVLGSPSLIILRFPWAKKQHFNNKRQQKTVRKLTIFRDLWRCQLWQWLERKHVVKPVSGVWLYRRMLLEISDATDHIIITWSAQSTALLPSLISRAVSVDVKHPDYHYPGLISKGWVVRRSSLCRAGPSQEKPWESSLLSPGPVSENCQHRFTRCRSGVRA